MKLKSEMQVLLNAIQEAGQAVIQARHEGFTSSYKINNDPLTTADLLSNQILKDRLLNAFPTDGWLSEETTDNLDRLNYKRIWIVDPIDGTREFIKGIPEYAVSVALVENGIPIVSAVYNPAKNELFYAIKDQGAWFNHDPIKCQASSQDKLKILASRTEIANGDWQQFLKINEIKPMGSIAYKLALIAAGFADSTFSLSPKCEWDIAAGVLLVREAGGLVTDKYKNNFVFNQLNTRVNSIIACTSASFATIYSQIM